ncbi:ankyrin repeat domain-containing protein [Thiothrix winogradskyi]|uniref:Ankyrin repeat domain-containing protein n=1 Tax=Thiothrix winogradskyi TaxID=96472 RepID=A0ABY3STD9_9GAMM|nr:ankyrin repeat domain-containing protein [Thiothrix winogradskyi]UJS22666.1 ankyrin repeat domain-containing protein [Thiothrix winogradskyi]
MHKKETFISIEKQNNADKIERLHNAVWLQDYDMIKNILENGENINKLDNDGRTALDIANICKNNTIKDFLISHGAQENNK